MTEGTAIVIATAVGPLAAVLITLWHQDRKEKRAAKERLFVTLMAHRKSVPISLDWARALNLIDVVYGDNPKVLRCWHDLFDYVHIKPMDQRQFDYKSTELLSQMAQSLGYKSLQQIDIDRFYGPQAHTDEALRNYELQTELLRVLKSTERLSVERREEPPAKP
ncbi:MAG TPA: DUF6680 family protein [Burkholderiales bacterium]|nr:DUF6680 family protein [Burkholderiales bacterium]